MTLHQIGASSASGRVDYGQRSPALGFAEARGALISNPPKNCKKPSTETSLALTDVREDASAWSHLNLLRF